jgi:hypothetical protein
MLNMIIIHFLFKYLQNKAIVNMEYLIASIFLGVFSFIFNYFVGGYFFRI